MFKFSKTSLTKFIMGTVVIHAGIPKAGSSSVQTWLIRNALKLRRELDITVLVAHSTNINEKHNVPLPLTVYKSGPINSYQLITRYMADKDDKKAIVENFFEHLDEHASRHPVVVISSEAFAHIFWRVDEQFLNAFEDLANHHEVRIAYYVRPQHTALEAAWRQWGFRKAQPPSQYIANRSKQLHYLATYSAMRKHMPHVFFELRPFRKDLLDSGNIVIDFARHFLGLDNTFIGSQNIYSNRGLPLEVVNVLRSAPPGLFWSSPHQNNRLKRIKRLLANFDFQETEDIRLSRYILQQYCHRIFEDDNIHLISSLQWNTANFVPPIEFDFGIMDSNLSALDELWKPKASDIELELLHLALAKAISSSP